MTYPMVSIFIKKIGNVHACVKNYYLGLFGLIISLLVTCTMQPNLFNIWKDGTKM